MQRFYQVIYARVYPIVPVKLAFRGMGENCLRMDGLTLVLVKPHAEANQAVDCGADHEVN